MALADLPSKDVLQAKLLGLLLAPASTLVRLINTPASQVAQVLKAYSEKGEQAANRCVTLSDPVKMWYADRLPRLHRADRRANKTTGPPSSEALRS